MSPAVEHLVGDLKRIAAPDLPRDRDLALNNLRMAPRVEDINEPLLGPLTRMAKSLALALRRGVPSGVASRLHAIAGELAAAIGEMPEGYRPDTEDPAKKKPRPHYTPGVDRD